MSSRRHLVVARVGRASLHPTWLLPTQPRSWDLRLCPFQPIDVPPRADIIVGDVVVGPKWTGLRQLLNTWDGWRDYDYVWLPDDDVFVSQAAIDRLFHVAAALEFDLCAPALHDASYYAHYTTMRNHRFSARRTGFVEIMVPCFSRRALERLLPTFDLTPTGWGWGLDSLWPKLLDYSGVGMIDDVTVLRTRPVGMFRDEALGRAVRAESDAIMASHDCRQVHTTFAGIGADLRPCRLLPEALSAALVDGWRYLFDNAPEVLPWIVAAQASSGRLAAVSGRGPSGRGGVLSALWTAEVDRAWRRGGEAIVVPPEVAAVREAPQADPRTRDATIASVRLGRAALAQLPKTVKVPQYDVDALRPGVLHIGCGAFHRAHQALLTQRAIEVELPTTKRAATPAPWGIVATALRNPDLVRTLDQQDGLYTVLERGPAQTRVEVVGTLRETLFAPESGAALDRAFADPQIRIVTLTVTSSGYSVDATGRLDAESPAIQDDLRSERPSSAIGLLTRGLATRRDSGGAPPVILSCDNLASNGRVLQQACVDYASLQDDALATWIGSAVQFPATMVDRIVPATTDEDRAFAARALGLKDWVPVSAEPFSQWVIERFDGPRPRWDAVGAEYVADVAPWEASKLRLLNGGHLAVAYLGLLAGCSTVSEALAQPVFGDFALQFMVDEQKPTLPPSDHDIEAYARQLLARWRNGGIVHPLQRIGRDGGAKLSGRLLSSLQDNLAVGRPAPCTTLAVAAWMLCVTQDDAAGQPLLHDETADAFRAMRRAFGDDVRGWVDAALEVRGVFGDVLPRDPTFAASLAAAIVDLRRHGPLGAMQACRDRGAAPASRRARG